MKKLLLILMTVAIGACGLKRTADNMESSTNELRDNSRQLKNDSSSLFKRMDDTERELTFKEAAFMMEQNLRWLFAVDKPADSLYSDVKRFITRQTPPNDEPSMITHAGYTIESMWFQFWKGDFHEDHGVLDERFDLAAKILLTYTMTYTPHNA
jgi:hypothetical protein